MEQPVENRIVQIRQFAVMQSLDFLRTVNNTMKDGPWIPEKKWFGEFAGTIEDYILNGSEKHTSNTND